MKLRIQAYSDKGCIRDGNEDMLSFAGTPVRDGNLERDFDITDDDYFYLFVIDGMGGHEKGGVVWYFGRVFLLNASDSRTYRWRDGLLTQLTTDETERGLTGTPEASKLLLNCIGGGAKETSRSKISLTAFSKAICC